MCGESELREVALASLGGLLNMGVWGYEGING